MKLPGCCERFHVLLCSLQGVFMCCYGVIMKCYYEVAGVL